MEVDNTPTAMDIDIPAAAQVDTTATTKSNLTNTMNSRTIASTPGSDPATLPTHAQNTHQATNDLTAPRPLPQNTPSVFSTPHLPLTPPPIKQTSYPEAIIGELTPNPPAHSSNLHLSPTQTATHYLITFLPNAAGIVTDFSRPIEKSALRARFPNIVAAWEAKARQKYDARVKARSRTQGLSALMWGSKRGNSGMEGDDGGLEMQCEQGNRWTRHWGEVRLCSGHLPDQPNDAICKGCRVEHWGLVSFGLGGRGARVGVCVDCAQHVRETGIGNGGVRGGEIQRGGNVFLESEEEQDEGFHGVGQDDGRKNEEKERSKRCVCETRWKCWTCREAELNELARAKAMWEAKHEGRCGRCLTQKGTVETIGWCVSCNGVRIYETI